MANLSPSPEFENKVKAAVSAPSADPQFVNRLRAQLLKQTEAQNEIKPFVSPVDKEKDSQGKFIGWLTHLRVNLKALPITFGDRKMTTRFVVPALAAVILIAVTAFLILDPPIPVSAQQILSRATQMTAKVTAGIEHYRLELYQNPQALPGDQAGTTTIEESYYDQATSKFRIVTRDAAGNITGVSANDGSYQYYLQGVERGSTSRGLTISRKPVDVNGEKIIKNNVIADDRVKALFDEFNNNPNIELAGKIAWRDGSPAYVLLDRNYETSKTPDGREIKILTGTVKMIFDAQTYRLLEIQITLRKDGQDILVDAARWLVQETLPENSQIAWDLSDLQGVTIMDEPQTRPESVQSSPQIETLTEHELALRAKAYVLKTIPAGLTLEIIAVADQPKDQDYHFEVNYKQGEYLVFGLQAVGKLEEGFVAKSFYDGSYKAASGLTMYYSISSRADYTSAMLVTPDGFGFLLSANMSREQVQNLAEDLVPAK